MKTKLAASILRLTFVVMAISVCIVGAAPAGAVVDLESLRRVGEIPDILGAHGAVVVPDLGVGFTSNGRENTSSVFDPKTLKVSEKIKVDEGPDVIVYDPASGNVFTMNGRGRMFRPRSARAPSALTRPAASFWR